MNPLDLFTGEVNEHVAHVYARLPRTHANQKITGRIRGPFNQFAQTLPANAIFRDLGPGDTVLARAVVTDPCTWSSDSPALYQVKIETTDETGKTIIYEHKHFGIRRFEARGKDLYLDGKRYVVRGMYGAFLEDDYSIFRELAAVKVMGYSREALQLAATHGVGVILYRATMNSSDLAFFREIAQFPCVLMVVLAYQTPPENVKSLLPNLLFAEPLQPHAQPSPWADVAWVRFVPNLETTEVLNWNLPTFFARLGLKETHEETREACDKLQSDLAPLGQFAGYVV